MKKSVGRSLALIDCNNFYVSCERAFRPDLSNRPVVVLSNNDGCVVSRSAEAKAAGVRMAAPWFKLEALARQHGIVAFSSNYALYADMSNRVMSMLSDFSPMQEVYSIDECFLDLGGFDDIRERAYEIRRRVLQWTGLPVCVGIGPSKTLAKLANHVAKQHPRSAGVFDYNRLTPIQQRNVLGNIAVGDIWGIGRRLYRKLNEMGIETALDLREADAALLRTRFGVVLEQTVRELRGDSCLEMEDVVPPRKQVLTSRSFGSCVTTREDLEDAMTCFAATASAKLREQHSVARFMQIFIRTDRHREEKKQYNPSYSLPLAVATSDTLEIAKLASVALREIYRSGFEYKKAGIVLGDLYQDGKEPDDLFDVAANTSRKALMKAMDGINARYGRGVIGLTSDDACQPWSMRMEHRSPAYTTQWNDMMRCR